MSLEKSPKSFHAKFPRQNCGQNVWAKCVGKLWANLGQEMLYDGDISGDDEYTLETLQAAAVEILGSPSGKDRGYSRSRYELGNKCVIMTHFCCEIICCCCLIDRSQLQLNH